MSADRLLTVATLLCGCHARQTVFEPLVADWQREWLATRGPVRRALVMAKGGAAYATSLALRIDTRETVQRHAIGIGWSSMALLAAIGGWALYLYTLPWILLTWSSRSDGVLEGYPFEYLIWHVPAVMTYGLLFAVLPACLALAAGGMRARGLLAALSVAVVTFVAIDGWWTARWREGNLRQYHDERAIAGNFRVLTSDALILSALSPDPRIADPARSALLPRLTMPVSLIGLGLIGAAIGRRRARTNRAIGLRIVVGSWLGGWLAASVLGSLAGYQGMYRQPADPGPTMWVPPLMMLGVGLTALIVNARAQRSAPPPERA